MLYSFFKRLFDILFGLVGIIFVILFYIIVRIIYLATGDYHRIILIQPRIGKNGKVFKFFKFRTMVINAEDELENLLKDKKLKKEYELNRKLENDPRITKAGKIIRRTSIDEFPQFINILFGQMSLIGNRPYLPREKKAMGKYFNIITKTKPGLTGYWQANLRSRGNFKERIRMDVYYSEHYSFALDTQIFFKTFATIFKKSNAK